MHAQSFQSGKLCACMWCWFGINAIYNILFAQKLVCCAVSVENIVNIWFVSNTLYNFSWSPYPGIGRDVLFFISNMSNGMSFGRRQTSAASPDTCAWSVHGSINHRNSSPDHNTGFDVVSRVICQWQGMGPRTNLIWANGFHVMWCESGSNFYTGEIIISIGWLISCDSARGHCALPYWPGGQWVAIDQSSLSGIDKFLKSFVWGQ